MQTQKVITSVDVTILYLSCSSCDEIEKAISPHASTPGKPLELCTIAAIQGCYYKLC